MAFFTKELYAQIRYSIRISKVTLKGADFVRQLKVIVHLNIFRPVKDEKNIYSAEASHLEDFEALLDAARKAVYHGNKVYILPNPKSIRTPDFIFENKGIYKTYDLKTISGKTSLENRLMESIGQTNHVLLNVCTTYNIRLMALQIKNYFEANPEAIEVIIYKGKQMFTIKRKFALQKSFITALMKRYK